MAPTQKIVYLGVEFNSVDMTVSLPAEKLQKLYEELNFFEGKIRDPEAPNPKTMWCPRTLCKSCKGGENVLPTNHPNVEGMAIIAQEVEVVK